MKKQISKKHNGLDISTDSKQKTKDFMVSNGLYNPDKIIENFAQDMDKNKGKEMTPKLYGDYQRVAMTLGLDTHLPMADALPEEYRPMLINITREVEAEYACTTVIEKSLAEIIASAHIRVVHYTKILNSYIANETTPEKSKTDFYNMLGKEIERAQRQLTSTALTLKQMKVPTVPFNVSAKTAFIAQNQQFNNYGENNERQ
ncbi:hypothetical protein H6804_00030 [Candidatus Nomurabacteria bacterium]|nr:hypothetical protein [Candidatus Nomurabacteria bacterium]MCB9826653.1 hypothetical protein [Candidatus Nomurabacteria bacterium]